MSDTEGHGNFFNDSYPLVVESLMAPIMAEAGIQLSVKNMAMGGVPSYPTSLCMEDVYGDDTDVVVWDFRMVERDPIMGEVFIRQGLMHPRRPAIMFKRDNAYLKSLSNYFKSGSIHIVDERALVKFMSRHSNETIRANFANDSFCASKPCPCPGQVRWHAGYKMNRLRAVHMASVYLGMFHKALDRLRTRLHSGEALHTIRTEVARQPFATAQLAPSPSPRCLQEICNRRYSCATSWEPHGAADMGRLMTEGESKWELQFPDSRSKAMTTLGHSQCHYRDAKKQLVGTQRDGWQFLAFNADRQDGVVAFCADLPPKTETPWQSKMLVLLNGEEIQDDLNRMLEAKTLGVHSACFGYDGIVHGKNSIGFRVMEEEFVFRLTHLFWQVGTNDGR